jgi:hypothetical protein
VSENSATLEMIRSAGEAAGAVTSEGAQAYLGDYGVGLGVLPFTVLALIAPARPIRWVLLLGVTAAFAIDVAAAVPTLSGQSSAAGVGLMVAPVVSLELVGALVAFAATAARLRR